MKIVRTRIPKKKIVGYDEIEEGSYIKLLEPVKSKYDTIPENTVVEIVGIDGETLFVEAIDGTRAYFNKDEVEFKET